MATERDVQPAGMASETVPRGHERRDANVRAIVWSGVGLVVVAVIAHVALWIQLHGLSRQREAELPPRSPVAEALPAAPPEPRLQTAPHADLADLRGEEEATLGSYGWVDRRAGIVRVPIDRAIELLVREAAR